MRVIKDYPPNYEAIVKAIPDVKNSPNIIFSYGHDLYIPSGIELGPDYMVHEETHGREQIDMGVDIWWDKYLADPRFRLEQELKAYRRQYGYATGRYPKHIRKSLLEKISKDLSSEMYGGIVDQKEARDLITGAKKL